MKEVPAMNAVIVAEPLFTHTTAEERPDGDVDGSVAIGGVQVWRDTYPPGTRHDQVLGDMLRNLAGVLNDARLGR